jgi:hypothetical protein
MIDYEQAKALAMDFLTRMPGAYRNEMVIIDGRTEEKYYGWIIAYQSRLFIETGEKAHMLIVERASGKITPLRTGRPITEQITEYEENRMR